MTTTESLIKLLENAEKGREVMSVEIGEDVYSSLQEEIRKAYGLTASITYIGDVPIIIRTRIGKNAIHIVYKD